MYKLFCLVLTFFLFSDVLDAQNIISKQNFEYGEVQVFTKFENKVISLTEQSLEKNGDKLIYSITITPLSSGSLKFVFGDNDDSGFLPSNMSTRTTYLSKDKPIELMFYATSTENRKYSLGIYKSNQKVDVRSTQNNSIPMVEISSEDKDGLKNSEKSVSNPREKKFRNIRDVQRAYKIAESNARSSKSEEIEGIVFGINRENYGPFSAVSPNIRRLNFDISSITKLPNHYYFPYKGTKSSIINFDNNGNVNSVTLEYIMPHELAGQTASRIYSNLHNIFKTKYKVMETLNSTTSFARQGVIADTVLESKYSANNANIELIIFYSLGTIKDEDGNLEGSDVVVVKFSSR